MNSISVSYHRPLFYAASMLVGASVGLVVAGKKQFSQRALVIVHLTMSISLIAFAYSGRYRDQEGVPLLFCISALTSMLYYSRLKRALEKIFEHYQEKKRIQDDLRAKEIQLRAEEIHVFLTGMKPWDSDLFPPQWDQQVKFDLYRTSQNRLRMTYTCLPARYDCSIEFDLSLSFEVLSKQALNFNKKVRKHYQSFFSSLNEQLVNIDLLYPFTISVKPEGIVLVLGFRYAFVSNGFSENSLKGFFEDVVKAEKFISSVETQGSDDSLISICSSNSAKLVGDHRTVYTENWDEFVLCGNESESNHMTNFTLDQNNCWHSALATLARYKGEEKVHPLLFDRVVNLRMPEENLPPRPEMNTTRFFRQILDSVPKALKEPIEIVLTRVKKDLLDTQNLDHAKVCTKALLCLVKIHNLPLDTVKEDLLKNIADTASLCFPGFCDAWNEIYDVLFDQVLNSLANTNSLAGVVAGVYSACFKQALGDLILITKAVESRHARNFICETLENKHVLIPPSVSYHKNDAPITGMYSFATEEEKPVVLLGVVAPNAGIFLCVEAIIRQRIHLDFLVLYNRSWWSVFSSHLTEAMSAQNSQKISGEVIDVLQNYAEEHLISRAQRLVLQGKRRRLKEKLDDSRNLKDLNVRKNLEISINAETKILDEERKGILMGALNANELLPIFIMGKILFPPRALRAIATQMQILNFLNPKQL